MTVIPSAPAGTSVTSAGSWYRQENSNRSDTSSSAAPEVNSSRQARAGWRIRVARPPAQQGGRAGAGGQRGERHHRAGGIAAAELVGAQEAGDGPPDGAPPPKRAVAVATICSVACGG